VAPGIPIVKDQACAKTPTSKYSQASTKPLRLGRYRLAVPSDWTASTRCRCEPPNAPRANNTQLILHWQYFLSYLPRHL